MRVYGKDFLVTVAICTYNSSRYILDTLESIKNQTYIPLELVISDDASIDDTLAVVYKWCSAKENKSRFRNIEILEVPKNTGVSANANRALKAAKGTWIKYIAGDDALKIDCIEHNIQWIFLNPEIRALFSGIEVYNQVFEPSSLIDVITDADTSPGSFMALERDAIGQYKMLLVSDRIPFAPTAFLHRDTLISIGGFDEQFRLLEDYPLWLRLTRNGHRLYFMNIVTVMYRRHSAAINNNEGLTRIVNPNYFKTESFRKRYTYPFLPVDLRLEQKFRWGASQIFRSDLLNQDTLMRRLLYDLVTIYINPFRLFIYFKKRFSEGYRSDPFYL